MLHRGLVPLLVALALLLSGCTQQGTQGTPTPDFSVRNIPPSASPGAGGAQGAGGLGPATAGTGSAAVSGTSSALGSDIVGCAAGTPWEYSGGSATSTAGYKVTYTIEGKTFYKGSEYCKVSGKVEAQAGVPPAYLPTFDYYFKVDPTGAGYADIWYSYTLAGQTQEVHVVSGAGTAAAGTTSAPSTEATATGATVTAGTSSDIVNCVPGTPWTYAGATAAGGYTYSWKIEGKTDYKGSSGWCKVVGTAQGSGVPAGYSFEYYFKGFDAAKGSYGDLCYKINLGYAGAPPQEACVYQGGVAVTPGK